jgi:hypothetical protein
MKIRMSPTSRRKGKSGNAGGGGDGGNQVPDVLAAAKKGMREAAKNKAENKAKELYAKLNENTIQRQQLEKDLTQVQEELTSIYKQHS